MGQGAYTFLEPYVPTLVRDWERLSPGARHRAIDGSMVFVDVSGFTTMSERLARRGKVGAEEVTDVIGETFDRLLAEAYACGGGLLKFGGDALLLFFSGEGHPHRATAAAHGMRAELRRSDTFSTSAGKVTLRMSVGAHSGLFHFFLVGGSHRELIVAGPATTETVTMEAAASAGQILLSRALAAALPRANRGRELGPGVLLAGTPPEVERTAVRPRRGRPDLEPYVPVALRETVLAGEVEPEHRSVTIAFLHFDGLDDRVLRGGPEAAADALDALVHATQQAVEARGVAFLASDVAHGGGKLIITAGAPVVTGADEEQVLLAVREIVAAETGLPLHVGVNRGPVYAGAVGPSYRKTYTVMGDPVNLAARLMARAEAGAVIATPAVLAASRTIFETTDLEPFHVKGKKLPIVASAVGAPSGSRATIAEAGLPLLGRDEELAALLAAWDAAGQGEGRVVEIVAEPGLGKSRLLDELLARVGDTPVIRAECRVFQVATPYFPFRALLRTALGLDGLDDAAAVAALARLVEQTAPELLPWLPLIAAPLDLDVAPSAEVEALDDEFRRSRLDESVAALVARVASEPAVVVIEDTHWMDEPSRDLLARTTERLAASPWLVVLTRRPGREGYVVDDRSGGVVRLELRPLGSAPVIDLIRAATVEAPLRPQQERELADRASGNPLFLIELLDALRRGDEVDALPASVEGLIQARIDSLPIAQRRRLRALSVMGSGFRVDHASATLGAEHSADVRAALRPLGEFLSVDRTGWVQFRHALIRDAAYAGLPYRRRQELHARVGDSILRAAGEAPEEQAELLAVHYWHARRWEQAWRFARIAGDRARTVYANVEAARFYERALSASQRLERLRREEVADLWRSLGEVREAVGEFDEAFEAFRRATLLSTDRIEMAELHERRAMVRYRIGAYRAALRETALGSKLVASRRSLAAQRARSSLMALRARIKLQQGHLREAIVIASAAARDAERTGARAALARSYSALDLAYERLGEPEKAVYELLALDIWRELGEQRVAAITEMNLGVRGYDDGRWDEAVSRYLAAKETLERVGDSAHAGLVSANLGEVLISRGATDEAEAVLRDARRALRASRFTDAAMFADIQVGRLAVTRGRLDEAVSILEQAVEEAASIHQPLLALDASVQLAIALVDRADAAGAVALLDEAERAAGDAAAGLRVPLARVRGVALTALGRFDEADAELTRGLPLARQQKLRYEELMLLRSRAVLTRARGAQPDELELREADDLAQLLSVR
jgi:class 3 adenylate cyclase/tetratricopeptide (TPR) repeat protein